MTAPETSARRSAGPRSKRSEHAARRQRNGAGDDAKRAQRDATKSATPALPPRQAQIVDRLLDGETNAEIAAALGIDRSTVWRVRTDPQIAAMVDAARELRMFEIRDRLLDLSHRAVDVLGELMTNAATPPAVRVKAAAEILDRAGHLPEGPAGLRLDELTVTDSSEGPFEHAFGPAPTRRRLKERT